MWVLPRLLCTVFFFTRTFGAQIPDNFIEDEIQYEVEPPQDIRVQCNSNDILVNVDTVHNIFNGMIYPMGLSKNSSCMTEFSQTAGPVRYRLPLRSCNTMSTQLANGDVEFFNTIIVQPHRKLVTNKGRGFHVRCRYQQQEDASDTPNESSSILSTKMPVVTMRIFNSDTTQVVVTDNVKIGDPLTIVINMNDTDGLYGLYVTDCSVQDGLGWSQQHLIDAYGYKSLNMNIRNDQAAIFLRQTSQGKRREGDKKISCPEDPEIMGQFLYDENLTKAVVHFQAHKFPYTASVYYQCSVHLCKHENNGCSHVPPQCSVGDTKRRSRRQEKKNQDEGSEAMIEVYSGLYVNEATDAKNQDQIDQTSEKLVDDPYNICVSQRSFAVAIAIAGLVLMLLTVIAILIILTRRRTPRKDISTTGSSIYSGPYTNTAYSHTS